MLQLHWECSHVWLLLAGFISPQIKPLKIHMSSLGDFFFLSPFLFLLFSLLPPFLSPSLSLSFFFFFNYFFLPNNTKWWCSPLKHRRSITGKMQDCLICSSDTVGAHEARWPPQTSSSVPAVIQGAGLCHVAPPGEEDSGGPAEPGGPGGHDPPLAASREQEQRPGAARGPGVQPAEPGEPPGRPPRDPFLSRVISWAVRRLESPRKDPSYPQQPDRPLLHERVSSLSLASIPAERDAMKWK